MDEEIIRKVAIEKKLANVELFVDFFSERFPNEDNRVLSYVSEWADRFNSGTPENYMDNQSKEIYLNLAKKIDQMNRCAYCGKKVKSYQLREGECPACRASDRATDMAVGDKGG